MEMLGKYEVEKNVFSTTSFHLWRTEAWKVSVISPIIS